LIPGGYGQGRGQDVIVVMREGALHTQETPVIAAKLLRNLTSAFGSF
jgi:hypothetical protein